jgi:hypothetical protein
VDHGSGLVQDGLAARDDAASSELRCVAGSGHGCLPWRFQEEEAVAVILIGGSSWGRSGGCELAVLRGDNDW